MRQRLTVPEGSRTFVWDRDAAWLHIFRIHRTEIREPRLKILVTTESLFVQDCS
jgi:hypothetical protein